MTWIFSLASIQFKLPLKATDSANFKYQLHPQNWAGCTLRLRVQQCILLITGILPLCALERTLNLLLFKRIFSHTEQIVSCAFVLVFG